MIPVRLAIAMILATSPVAAPAVTLAVTTPNLYRVSYTVQDIIPFQPGIPIRIGVGYEIDVTERYTYTLQSKNNPYAAPLVLQGVSTQTSATTRYTSTNDIDTGTFDFLFGAQLGYPSPTFVGGTSTALLDYDYVSSIDDVSVDITAASQYGLQTRALSVALVDASPMSALPEPTNWMAMVLGFGVIGAAKRRRKVSASFGWIAPPLGRCPNNVWPPRSAPAQSAPLTSRAIRRLSTSEPGRSSIAGCRARPNLWSTSIAYVCWRGKCA